MLVCRLLSDSLLVKNPRGKLSLAQFFLRFALVYICDNVYHYFKIERDTTKNLLYTTYVDAYVHIVHIIWKSHFTPGFVYK